MSDYLSLFLYFFFFLGGFLIDFKVKKKNIVRKWFVFFLYVFLCFGYMTGSDWRGYEMEYNYSQDTLDTARYEMGFYVLFDLLHKVVHDFWIALALLKCIYLHSVIKVLKKLTDKWLAAISLLMPIGLLFMLIDNPLRFMVANIFVNFSIYFFLSGNKWLSLLSMVAAPLFQVTTIIVFPFFLLTLMGKKIVNINKYVLIILYIFVTIIFAFPSAITSKIEDISLWMELLFNSRSYSSYFVNNNNEVFTIGSALKAIVAIIVLYNKDKILSNGKYSLEICLFTIVYLMLDRVLVIIPSGFRLAIPFSLFFVAGLLLIIVQQKIFFKRCFIPFLYFLTLTSSLTRGYVYIPYSNSIYYIITEHKPYSEREKHNLDAMKKRTGHEHVHRTND